MDWMIPPEEKNPFLASCFFGSLTRIALLAPSPRRRGICCGGFLSIKMFNFEKSEEITKTVIIPFFR